MFEDVTGKNTLNVTLTSLRKYVSYAIQILAYTRMGDGKLSSEVIRKTDEDGERSCFCSLNVTVLPFAYRSSELLQELFKGLIY